VNIELEVWDFTKIPLKHFTITVQPDPFAVVIHFVMNEMLQLGPILPVETGDIVAVDEGKTGVGQIACLRWGVAAERLGVSGCQLLTDIS